MVTGNRESYRTRCVLENQAKSEIPPYNDEEIQVQRELKIHNSLKQLNTNFQKEKALRSLL